MKRADKYLITIANTVAMAIDDLTEIIKGLGCMSGEKINFCDYGFKYRVYKEEVGIGDDAQPEDTIFAVGLDDDGELIFYINGLYDFTIKAEYEDLKPQTLLEILRDFENLK